MYNENSLNKIGIFGFYRTDELIIKALLSVLSKKTGQAWATTSDRDAEVLFFDVDTREGRQAWRGASCTNRRQIRVAYSITAPEIRPRFFLPKPIRSRHLGQILSRLSTERQDTAAPLGQVSSAVEPGQAAGQRGLLGLLRRQADQQPIRVQYRDSHILFVDRSARRFFYTGGRETIGSLFQRKTADFQTTKLSREELSTVEQRLLERPIDQLWWYAATTSMRGRLLPEIDPNQSYRLRRVPNFGMSSRRPYHARLGSYMTLHSGHIDTIAYDTHVTRAKVIDFINACYLCGWLITDTSDGGHPSPPGRHRRVLPLARRHRLSR